MSVKNGLPTSGKLWGLSCVVDNEAVMGAILGTMKLWGAQHIGFDVVAVQKDPVRVAAGKKSKGRPKGASVTKRQPPVKVVKAFFAKLKGNRFETSDLRHHMKKYGWKSTNALHNALNQLLADKHIKRIGAGVYVRTSGNVVALRKKEAA